MVFSGFAAPSDITLACTDCVSLLAAVSLVYYTQNSCVGSSEFMLLRFAFVDQLFRVRQLGVFFPYVSAGIY